MKAPQYKQRTKKPNLYEPKVKGLERLLKDYPENTFGYNWISGAIKEIKLQADTLKKINSAMSRNLTPDNKIALTNDALFAYEETRFI